MFLGSRFYTDVYLCESEIKFKNPSDLFVEVKINLDINVSWRIDEKKVNLLNKVFILKSDI